MDDREQCDGARYRSRRLARRRFQRLELAPTGAVHDVPPARAQPLANGVCRFEVLLPAELDALGEQPLCFLLV
jgi:hypothetical protein